MALPQQSIALRTFAIPELLEAILLAFVEPEVKIAKREPMIQLLPLLRISRFWHELITTSPNLNQRMFEPPSRAISFRPLPPLNVKPLAALMYDFGTKIDAAWMKARKTGRKQGSWTKVVVLESEKKDNLNLIWRVQGIMRHVEITPGTTFGELFDRVENELVGKL